jgi:3-oxoacyl-[acyl-carrier protein] reductase
MKSCNKIILITGTRKGIGRSLAEYYLSEGHIVIGCSRANSDLLNINYKHFNCDVSEEKNVLEIFRHIRSQYGRLDILINNAGLASLNHILLTPISTVKKLFETNLLGTFLFSREASKLMRRNNFGRIINFSTVAVPLNLEGETIYAASKSAVEQLTKNMAKELGTTGITINAIGPTPIETDLIKTVPKDKIDKLLASQSIPRFGIFSDVINVMDFFISEKSDFITGQIIYLGGVVK